MDTFKPYYYVQLPLAGQEDGWWTVARADSTEGAAEVVRVLLANPKVESTQVRIERRMEP